MSDGSLLFMIIVTFCSFIGGMIWLGANWMVDDKTGMKLAPFVSIAIFAIFTSWIVWTDNGKRELKPSAASTVSLTTDAIQGIVETARHQKP